SHLDRRRSVGVIQDAEHSPMRLQQIEDHLIVPARMPNSKTWPRRDGKWRRKVSSRSAAACIFGGSWNSTGPSFLPRRAGRESSSSIEWLSTSSRRQCVMNLETLGEAEIGRHRVGPDRD